MQQSVTWPAIVKYSGDDELVYVNDQAEWLSDSGLSCSYYDVSDRLLDSQGRLFSLPVSGEQRVTPLLTDETITNQQLLDWLRRHFAVTGACCVAKINVASLPDCMQLLSEDRGN